MKCILFLTIGLLPWLACAADPAPAPTTPPPSANSVSIKAELIEAPAVHEKGDKKADKKSKVHTSLKQLAMAVHRVSSQDLGDLVVNWYIFGQDVAEHTTVKIASGELPLTLKGNTMEYLTNEPPVSVSYTPQWVQGGGGRTAGKVIKASGQRASGWAVRVMQGSAVVGEAYSSPELKNKLEAPAPGAKAPDKKPAAKKKK